MPTRACGRALQLVETVKDLDERIIKTEGHRKQINYPYWETLTQAEQEERTVNARRLVFEAKEALSKEGRLERAIELYEQSFQQWAEIFDDYPILVIDTSAEDLYESVQEYMKAIDSNELPEDFPLRTFVEMMGQYGNVDATVYEEVRNTQRDKLEARKAELAEEERQREEELMEAQKEEEEKAEAQNAEKETAATEKMDAENVDVEKKGLEPADGSTKEADMAGGEQDDAEPNETKPSAKPEQSSAEANDK